MTTQLGHMRRSSREDRQPGLSLAAGIALASGRVHECCGSARWTFALWLAGRSEGPVLWIHPAWQNHQLGPQAMAHFADPSRFLFAAAPKPEDLLWCAEEALRAGVAPLVVVDLPAPPALTPVRRLHLAAETGAAKTAPPPLGLLLTPEDGGAAGIESRWFMSGTCPVAPNGARHWRLERRRARRDPPRSWQVTRENDHTPLIVDPAPTGDHG